MYKKKFVLVLLFILTYLNIGGSKIDSFAVNDNVILDKNKIEEKLSIVTSTEEDINNMDKEELLEEIRKYDIEIIDILEHINTLNEQIDMIQTQIELLDNQEDTYIEEESSIQTFELNKLRAVFSLPSLYLSETTEQSIYEIFDKLEDNNIKSEKALLNAESLNINKEYKEDYLEEVEQLKVYLDEKSNDLNSIKTKINERIEELSRIEIQDSNPYITQGVNIDLPTNIEADELVLNIINITAQQIGIPYLWGGTTTKGFDCSGLLYYSFGKSGVVIPRVARDQQKVSVKIDYADIKPGDLVFWNNPATHVALYVGEGKIIEAPRTGLNVRCRYISLNEKGISFGRILKSLS